MLLKSPRSLRADRWANQRHNPTTLLGLHVQVAIAINLVLHYPCCVGIHASGMYCNAYPNAVVLGPCNPDRTLGPRIDITTLGSTPQGQARTVLWHGHCNHATNIATGQTIALLQGDMYFNSMSQQTPAR